ncbi:MULTISPECIES: energy-coupling factor transporter ATPase [Staphylococcus]|uniref:Energy-coupling factor transporter ATP-binding protein EcfA2 n=1 Tax=Staphylococcus lugdunensis TaxID=28035 RepID=A0ABX6BXM5_STALU|nr:MULTISPECIES: energy-coupling factor transporter ATPase [Staphylococcus]ADC86949.1 ATPase component of general energizing module of ECF transporters [Staphylococcus lugdunensis HKU09-01]ARB77229.1 energy-coupling factor transporter ATPase [Staphylococcus lugdunensis]ARJ08682.1 energy-coupling factor transporter ATPase [Staphylococcus lugdunensis]ARJ13430.1 energy-coupling factor transporter ATPase [Staphylococcus lugdunensis]ARJ15763.1 energy-coupling factor transporter ATPase [Staphylococc
MSITFNDVTYIYQKGTPYEKEAVSHIHLALEQGVYYALIGQTGSGKSTLIQHINGLIKPTTGSLSVGDITIHHKTKDKHIRTIRKTVGMVFQIPETQLFEDTVEREIIFGPKNFGMDIEQVKSDAFDLLMQLGFPRNIMSLSPFQMSGGQMRKIAIVSILAMNPDVIILDEPTAGLDPQSRFQIMTLLKKFQLEDNKTIILVTHDMNDVACYADQTVIMKEGQIVDVCTPRDLFAKDKYITNWHIALPDIVKLQKDIEDKHQIKFPHLALTNEEFVQMYKEWRQK